MRMNSQAVMCGLTLPQNSPSTTRKNPVFKPKVFDLRDSYSNNPAYLSEFRAQGV